MPTRSPSSAASNNSDINTYTDSFASQVSSIFTLPLELRQQIYYEIFNPAPELVIHASSTTKASPIFSNRFIPGSNLRSRVNASITQACKQLRFETLPILLDSLNLHITFDRVLHTPPFQPTQPCLTDHLPRYVLERIRYVTYHFPLLQDPSQSAQQRPAKTPFPFHQTSSLTRFCLRKSLRLNVDMLYDPAHGRMTRAVYEGLDADAKMSVWARTGLLDVRAILGTMARFGSGGWVSGLVAPETYGTASKKRDSDGNSPADRQYLDKTGLGVPPGCEVVVEMDVLLFVGQSWRPTHIETLVVEVSVKDKQVKSMRFLEGREMLERKFASEKV